MSGGYENALSTKLLATACIFCGRPLRDPESIERGYGPDCAEKYANDFTHGSPPTEIDRPAAANAIRLAPEPLKTRWLEIGGDPDNLTAPWSVDPELRREMLSIGLHYGAMAVSYGSDQLRTVTERVDAALLTIVSIANFARAIGYSYVAERMSERYTSRIHGDVITFMRSPNRKGAIGVHTPYSNQWLQVARSARNLFFASEKRDRQFFRFFHERDLGQVINMLQGVFGDAICRNPEGDLILLPSMPVPEPVPVTPPAPPPKTATDELPKIPRQSEGLKLGQRVRLPDGTESLIQYLDPKKKRVGVGETKGRGYKFFSFSEIETEDGSQVARAIDQGRREADRKEGIVDPAPEPTVLPRQLPEGLLPHQVIEIAFTEKHQRVLIGSEPGIGKTPVGVVSIDAPAIVVCPALLKVNWVRELNKWTPWHTVALIEGSAQPDPVVKDANVIVINYDILDSHIEWLKNIHARTLIADEAHYLKNLEFRWNKDTRRQEVDEKKSPKRAIAFHNLHLGIPKLMLLTGTPILNRTRELYPLLHLLDPKEWDSGFKFCQRYCAGSYSWIRQRGGGEKRIFDCSGRSNSDELHQRLTQRYMIRHTKAEVLTSLPPKSRRSMSVSLSTKYKAIYKKAANEFIKWVQQNGGAEKVALASKAEALTRLTALRGISAMGKVEAAIDHIREFIDSTGRPLIVMAVSSEAIAGIGAGIDEINREYETAIARGKSPEISKPIRYGTVVGGQSASSRQEVIDAFQLKATLDVIIYSIPIATGITLTRAQDMLFLERMWRPADQVQAEDRAHRVGQHNALTVTYMDAEGTIDIKMGMLLMDKASTSAAVIDGVNLSEEEASALVFGEMFDISTDFAGAIGDMMDDDDLEPNFSDGSSYDGSSYDSKYDDVIDSSWNDPI